MRHDPVCFYLLVVASTCFVPSRKAGHCTWTETFRGSLLLQLMGHASHNHQVGVATVALLTMTVNLSFMQPLQMICSLRYDPYPIIFTDPSNSSDTDCLSGVKAPPPAPPGTASPHHQRLLPHLCCAVQGLPREQRYNQLVLVQRELGRCNNYQRPSSQVHRNQPQRCCLAHRVCVGPGVRLWQQDA